MKYGCRLADTGEACRGCQGWYKKYTDKLVRYLILDKGIPPENLPCGTLVELAKRLIEHDRRETRT